MTNGYVREMSSRDLALTQSSSTPIAGLDIWSKKDSICHRWPYSQGNLALPYSRACSRRACSTNESTCWWWTKFMFSIPGANPFTSHSSASVLYATDFGNDSPRCGPLLYCCMGTRQTSFVRISTWATARLSPTVQTFEMTSGISFERSHTGSVEIVVLLLRYY